MLGKPRVVIIIQARMLSTRLPGKVLKVAGGKPLLQHVIERMRRVSLAGEVLVATTTNPADEPIVELCERLKVICFRGSEDDVLERYWQAADRSHADVIVRVTSDCPLIDPAIVDGLIQYYLDHQGKVDFVTNALTSTYPYGMEAELTTMEALTRAHQQARAKPDREHVMPYIHRQPDLFRVATLPGKFNYRQHRWTVDTPEDFELIQRIIDALYPSKPNFTMGDILELLSRHPEWSEINRAIPQKVYGQ